MNYLILEISLKSLECVDIPIYFYFSHISLSSKDIEVWSLIGALLMTYLRWFQMQTILKKIIFWHFHLWVLAISGPVEYSTGPKNVKYRQEIVDTLHGPFPKKCRTISRASSKMPLEFVFWPRFRKMALCHI